MVLITMMKELLAVDVTQTETCQLNTVLTVLYKRRRVTSEACFSVVSSAGLLFVFWPERVFKLLKERRFRALLDA